MATLEEYAALSARVYWDARGEDNKNPLPPNWSEITYDSDLADGALSGGLSAGAYMKGDEIVIAFKGTDFLFGVDNGRTIDDLIADVGLGSGAGSAQLIGAALFYEKIKAENPNKEITFTGHSLGAGLASIVSVWFNQRATIFADAPFYATAINGSFANSVLNALQQNGYAAPELASLVQAINREWGVEYAIDDSEIRNRESNVTSYYVQGEVLNNTFGSLSMITGSNRPIAIAGGDQVNSVTLHSIVLHAALLFDDKLRKDTLALPNLIATLFDETLYASRLESESKQDFLTKLLNVQIPLLGGDMSSGLLARFATDLESLAHDSGASRYDPLNKALLAAAIEDYYFMPADTRKAFFASIRGGIQFDLADIGADWSGKLGWQRLVAATKLLIGNSGVNADSIFAVANQWTVQTGDAGLVAIGKGNDVMIGGDQQDMLGGADGDDILVGGDGNDVLDGTDGTDILVGGAGNDTLKGGTGEDIYIYASGGGNDRIADADGNGTIVINGSVLPTSVIRFNTMKLANTWIDGDTRYNFRKTSLDGSIGTLTISGGILGDGQIQIDGFDINAAQSQAAAPTGYLGIHLSEQVKLMAGTSRAGSLLSSGDYSSADSQADAKGNLQTFTIYASAISDTEQTVKLALGGGNASSYAISTGADLLRFDNGSVTLAIPAGQDSVTVALLNIEDMEQAAAPQLTATLVDAHGDPQAGSTSNMLTVDFTPDSFTRPITNSTPQGQAQYDDQHRFTGTAYFSDGGNDLIDGSGNPMPETPDGIVNGINAANSGNSILIGSSGRDVFIGSNNGGNTIIIGNGGQDVIYSGTGPNRIYADDETDLLAALQRSSGATGQKGDFIFATGSEATVIGGLGNDVIAAGAGNVEIASGPGDNVVLSGVAGGGVLTDWSVTKGEKNGEPSVSFDHAYVISSDTQFDQNGNAFYAGAYQPGNGYEGNLDGYGNPFGNGEGMLFGGVGNDLFLLSNGDNYVDGGRGADSVLAGMGNDEAFGGDGDDLLLGRGGNDYLDGEDGSDTLVGGAGDDELFGGAGNDVLYAGRRGEDWATSTAGSNYVDGEEGDNLLYGAGGSDTLVAGNGNDTIHAGSGSAYIDGGDGDNLLIGGAGNDTIDGGSGHDRILAGSGTIMADGGAGADEVQGGSGADVLMGSSGADTLAGGDGDDVLEGGTGSDVLGGGAGDDAYRFNLGDGADSLADVAGGNTIAFGAGIALDPIRLEANADGSAFVLRYSDIDSIAIDGLSAGHLQYQFADGSLVTGQQMVSRLDAPLNLTATDSGMLLLGGSGADTLRGGSGADTLIGGEGDNLFVAGTGGGTMSGAGGLDTYVMTAGMGSYEITDDGAQPNRILLGEGLQLADLIAWRKGTALVLQDKNGYGSFEIQDYYAKGMDWTAQDAWGNAASVQSLVDATAEADLVARMEADFLAQAEADIIKSIEREGYGAQLDGTWYLAPMAGGYARAIDSTSETTLTVTTSPDPMAVGKTYTTRQETWEYGYNYSGGYIYGNLDVFAGTITLKTGTIDSNDAVIDCRDSSSLTNSGNVGIAVRWADGRQISSNYQQFQTTGYVYQDGTIGFQYHEGAVSASLFETISSTTRNVQATPVSSTLLPAPAYPGNGNGALPTVVPAPYYQYQKTYNLEQINVGPGNHTIHAGSGVVNAGSGDNVIEGLAGFIYTGSGNQTIGSAKVVYEGSGNNTIFDAGIVYGGTGHSTIRNAHTIYGGAGSQEIDGVGTYYGGSGDAVIDCAYEAVYGGSGDLTIYYSDDATVYGGSGNDLIVGYGEIAGGIGNDTMFGSYSGTEFIIDPSTGGHDLTGGIANNAFKVIDAYYRSQGIGDWQLRYFYPGNYKDSHGNIYTAEQAAGQAGQLTYIEPLPVVVKTNSSWPQPSRYYAASSTPAVSLGATSYQELAALCDQGWLAPTAKMSFKEGVTASDLHFSWGTVTTALSGLPDDPKSSYDTLNLDWGTGQNVRVILPNSSDPVGSGIQEFDFADGTRLSMYDMLRLAQQRNPLVSGTEGNDILNGTPGHDLIQGLGGDDQIYGWQNDDVLDGGAGNDYLNGDEGNDTLIGGAGNDTFSGGAGQDTYVFDNNSGHDTLYDWSVTDADTICFDDSVQSSDIAVARSSLGDLQIRWNGGASSITLQNWFFDQNCQNKQVKFADGTVWDAAFLASQMATPVAGTEWDDFLSMGSGNDLLNGLGGNDYLSGGDGDDTLIGGDGYDRLEGDAGDDTLIGGRGDDLLNGSTGNNSFCFEKGDGHDVIWSYDQTTGMLNRIRFASDILPEEVSVSNDPYGDLYLTYSGGADWIRINQWFGDNSRIGRVEFDNGIVWDAAELSRRVAMLSPTEYNDVILATAADDMIDGLAGDDQIYGNDGNDELLGNSGADYIKGNAGNDILQGGAGNDNLEDWEGSNALDGGDGDDYLYADAQASFLAGGRGNDENDSYATGNVIGFNAGDGADTVYLGNALTLSLGSGIAPDNLAFAIDYHDLVLTMGAGDSIRFASFLSDYTPANRPPIVLQIIGADIRSYDFNGLIVAFESAIAQGAKDNGWLLSPALAANLISTSADRAIGGALAYRYAMDGNLEALGAKAMQAILSSAEFGMAAQEVHVNNAPMLAMPLADQYAVEEAAFRYTLPPDAFVDIDAGDTLSYSAVLANGDALPSWLSFDAATRTFFGTPGAGDLGGLSVQVTATDNGGLQASGTLDLKVEAAPGRTLTGTAGPDLLRGASGNDTLNGGAGADTLIGGAGNDSYLVDRSGDMLIEQAAGGNDTVQSSISMPLGAELENLTLTGNAALNGRGNALDNVLIGNAGDNMLSGLAGADALFGNAGNDTLYGGNGIDTLAGGMGDDWYGVDNVRDAVIEQTGEGIDTVQAYASVTLAANVENLVLAGTAGLRGTGNSLDNLLLGNAGNNILDGQDGADTMAGGLGDDIYLVDHPGDVAREEAGQGLDQIKASVSTTLSANTEILVLSGSSAIDGTGNAEDNLIDGNAGGNRLDGAQGNDILQGRGGYDALTDSAGNNLFHAGTGDDTLIGGAGNDLFIGGPGNDLIATGGGHDIIAFNRGSGRDSVAASTGADDTVSLGNGIRYADLVLRKSGADLVLGTGNNEQITVKDWYAGSHGIGKLQMIVEGSADYDVASSDPTHNQKVAQFDFGALVQEFDRVRQEQTTLNGWAPGELLRFYVEGSNSAALGGELAYQYGRNNSLSALSFSAAQGVLSHAGFGLASQSFNGAASLDASPRLL